MIPLELKYDKDGLLYMKDENIFRKSFLNIDKRGEKDEFYQQYFYPIDSTEDYIIKYNCTCYTKKQIKKIKEMLMNLVCRQKDISKVDFPIGYFVHMKQLSGLIIRYYKNGVSCDNVFKLNDIEVLGKYYYHDEDNIHNLFMLFDELLNIVIELFDHGVLFTDLNPGNIILYNNQVKLIDFDYRYVFFDKKDEKLGILTCSFLRFVREILRELNLCDYVEDHNNFNDARKYIKKIESEIQRGR